MDLHHFDADPDTDPDPIFYPDADPDPDPSFQIPVQAEAFEKVLNRLILPCHLQMMRIRFRIQFITLMRIRNMIFI